MGLSRKKRKRTATPPKANMAEPVRKRYWDRLREELDRFSASLPPLGDSAPLIRRDRQR